MSGECVTDDLVDVPGSRTPNPRVLGPEGLEKKAFSSVLV